MNESILILVDFGSDVLVVLNEMIIYADEPGTVFTASDVADRLAKALGINVEKVSIRVDDLPAEIKNEWNIDDVVELAVAKVMRKRWRPKKGR